VTDIRKEDSVIGGNLRELRYGGHEIVGQDESSIGKRRLGGFRT